MYKEILDKVSPENLEECILEQAEYSLKVTSTIHKLNASITASLSSYPPLSPLTPLPLDTARSLLKQPTAPLPKFQSKEGEDFLKFITEFESTTKCFNYPDRDLLLLLKQQVEGRAKNLLGSLEADKQKFKEAKDLLMKAFASEEIRKASTIKKLSSLHLKEGEDPFIFIAELKSIIESITLLKINLDEIVKYFAWTALNERFRSHIVQITNNTHPSLQQILDNFFKACERYEQGKPKSDYSVRSKAGYSKYREKTNSLAVKAKISVDKACRFCVKDGASDSSHFTHLCPKFPTPDSKIEFLNLNGGCLRCGYFNHTTKVCKFSFRKPCSQCKRYHMDFLCRENNAQVTKANKSKEEVSKVSRETKIEKEAVSGIAVMPNITTGSVLPTFTFNIGDDTQLHRGLKDSGSQNTFVSGKLAKQCKFKVLNSNVKLSVKGFNGLKSYDTNMVEVPLKIGDNCYKITALVVPSIDLKLSLPSLG